MKHEECKKELHFLRIYIGYMMQSIIKQARIICVENRQSDEMELKVVQEVPTDLEINSYLSIKSIISQSAESNRE